MKRLILYVTLLCALFSQILLPEVLRVKPIFNCRKPCEEVFKTITMPLLQKNGIQFVDKEPDVVLVCGRQNIEKLSLRDPFIILEEGEGASIHVNTVRKCMRNPGCKAVFKNTTLRPSSLYNVSLRYHFALINGFRHQAIRLCPGNLKKIRNVLWDLHCCPFNENLMYLAQDTIDFNSPRPVDAFFGGSILVGGKSFGPKGKHRTRLIKKLKNIKNRNIVSFVGRIPKDEYIALLKGSKIAISPWGTGEWCWRDYEAIYSGALLIKPDTSFVKSIPDLYQNDKYYVACKADFSDLEEKISYILENYEQFTDMRKRARELLINHWDYEKIVYDFAQAIRLAVKG